MMDRYCEFCVNLRPVIYCKADAAYLCLSCDTKVHSANPLSKRHYRTLVCESCKRRPTYVRCYDHQKFICRGCDLSQHDASSQHHRRVVNSYAGCPSARDLGALWGFDLNNSVVDLETATSGSIDEDMKTNGSVLNKNASSVLQQLVNLLNVQKSQGDHISSLIHNQQEYDFDQFSQQSNLGGAPSHQHDPGLDQCSSPFAQLDHLASSETHESAIQEDSFWQCKNSVQSNQLWSHNMQDLGVCEEPSFLDDLSMPDIDLTFKNFEELFRTEQELVSIDNTTAKEISITIAKSSSKKARYASQIMSFSHSKPKVECSGTEYMDNGASPSCGSLGHHESMKSNEMKNGHQYAKISTHIN